MTNKGGDTVSRLETSWPIAALLLAGGVAGTILAFTDVYKRITALWEPLTEMSAEVCNVGDDECIDGNQKLLGFLE